MWRARFRLSPPPCVGVGKHNTNNVPSPRQTPMTNHLRWLVRGEVEGGGARGIVDIIKRTKNENEKKRNHTHSVQKNFAVDVTRDNK